MFPGVPLYLDQTGSRWCSFFLHPGQGERKKKEFWRVPEAGFPTLFVLLCYPKFGLGNSFFFTECLMYPMFQHLKERISLLLLCWDWPVQNALYMFTANLIF